MAKQLGRAYNRKQVSLGVSAAERGLRADPWDRSG